MYLHLASRESFRVRYTYSSGIQTWRALYHKHHNKHYHANMSAYQKHGLVKFHHCYDNHYKIWIVREKCSFFKSYNSLFITMNHYRLDCLRSIWKIPEDVFTLLLESDQRRKPMKQSWPICGYGSCHSTDGTLSLVHFLLQWKWDKVIWRLTVCDRFDYDDTWPHTAQTDLIKWQTVRALFSHGLWFKSRLKLVSCWPN